MVTPLVSNNNFKHSRNVSTAGVSLKGPVEESESSCKKDNKVEKSVQKLNKVLYEKVDEDYFQK